MKKDINYKDKFTYDCYYISDLLSDKSDMFAHNNKFGSWYELYNLKDINQSRSTYRGRSKEFIAYHMAHKIVKTFLDMLIKDLIFENIKFLFPISRFGGIKIIEFIKKGKRKIHLVFQYGDYMRTKIIKDNYYIIILTERWKKLLKQELDKKHTYY